MKTQALSFVLSALALPTAFADDGPRFRFFKEVKQGPDAEVLAITLDADIFKATRSGLPDLRVLDTQDKEVPYALEQVYERRLRKVPKIIASELVSARPLEGNALEVVVRLKEVPPVAAGLTIQTPLTNYEHSVRVACSPDGMTWSPLVDDALIYDYTRHMDVRQRDIGLPANSARWFKLTIQQVLDERESPFRQLTRNLRGGAEEGRSESTAIERRPFRIDRIDAWTLVESEETREPVKTEYPVDSVEVVEDAEAKVTRVRFGCGRAPLTALMLETPTRNFSRKTSVRAPIRRATKTEWSEVASGTIARIALASRPDDRLGLVFSENRSERYEIVIENGDGPPLEIKGVRAEGNTYRLMILASNGNPRRVVYGSGSAEAPSYDTKAVLAASRPDLIPAPLFLGPEVEDPRYQLTGPSFWSKLLKGPTGLSAAIVVMVAVLAWVLLRVGRQLNKLPIEDI